MENEIVMTVEQRLAYENFIQLMASLIKKYGQKVINETNKEK